ncbi:MAG: hypothetical protein LUG90_22670 [Clostridiaceae bacterium]|nr:hypothetical protein [Clostridiaceae bacterium]
MKMNQNRKYGAATKKQAASVSWPKGGRKATGRNWNSRTVPRAAVIPRRARRGI